LPAKTAKYRCRPRFVGGSGRDPFRREKFAPAGVVRNAPLSPSAEMRVYENRSMFKNVDDLAAAQACAPS
jgi:hypothetical protein